MAQYKGAASEGGRAMQLMKKREREREQLVQLKQKIAEARHTDTTQLTENNTCKHIETQSAIHVSFIILVCG